MEEVVQSISSYCEEPLIPGCWDCQQNMERCLTPILVKSDVTSFKSFVSPLDGKTVIDSGQKRDEHMRAHGVCLFDDIRPDFERNRKAIEAERKQTLKTDIVETLHRLDAGQKPTQTIKESEAIPN